MKNDTAIAVGGNIVLLVWVASGVIGTVTKDYTFMQLVTPIMTIYAGYLFGKPIFERISSQRNGGNGKNEK